METFIIIPVYNETIEAVKGTIRYLLPHFSNIVIVDDGSRDNIRLKRELADFPIYFLTHTLNLGQGAALQSGTDFALLRGGDIFIHFDADGQHNIEDLPEMIAAIQHNKADIIIGSRFLRKRDIAAIPYFRRKVLQVATYINWVFTGLKLSDAHNGLRVMNRNAALKIRLTENRQAHATEILDQVRQKKLQWLEMPSRVEYSQYSVAKGQSTMNMFNIFFDLILNKIFT